MHSIARVSVQFVYFHLYVLCLVYDEYDNKAIIIIIIIIYAICIRPMARLITKTGLLVYN